MDNLNDLFFCLKNFPDLEDEHINQGMTATYVQEDRPFQIVANANMENSYIHNTLKSYFSRLAYKWILFPPMSFYDWHTDIWGRNCSINIPIYLPDTASTYCRVPMYEPKDQQHFRRHLWYNIEPVEYIINKPTILNVTKFEHCVINPSKDIRIILSISLNETYDDVLNIIQKLPM